MQKTLLAKREHRSRKPERIGGFGAPVLHETLSHLKILQQKVLHFPRKIKFRWVFLFACTCKKSVLQNTSTDPLSLNFVWAMCGYVRSSHGPEALLLYVRIVHLLGEIAL